MSDQPPILPNVQITRHERPGNEQVEGYSDRDNFIRNMVTLLLGPRPLWWWETGGGVPSEPTPPVPLTPSASGRTPVCTLDEVKLWLRIEPDQTDEDPMLTQ